MSKGFFYALLAAIVWGLAPIFEKVALKKIEPLLAVTLRSIAISIALLTYLCLRIDKLKIVLNAGLNTISFVIIGGLLGGMIGQIFYFKSLQTWEASRAVPIAGSYPLFTFLLSFLILREPITVTKILGILSVIGGLYLLRLP